MSKRLALLLFATLPVGALAAPETFTLDVTREAVEGLTDPYVVRAIELCRQALEEARLEPDNIEKLLLVGGVTLMPYVRQRIAELQQRASKGLHRDRYRFTGESRHSPGKLCREVFRRQRQPRQSSLVNGVA